MNLNELLITSSASAESPACLWDYNNSNPLNVFKNGGVINKNCLEVFDQEYLLGCESGKPILHVWTLNRQEYLKNTRSILPGSATCLALCPRNLYLAAGINCKIYIWQVASGKLLSVQQKNYQPISVIKFSSDGDYLIIAGQDGILTVYNFAELINVSNSFLTQSDIGQIEPLYVKNDHSLCITGLHVGSFGRKSRFTTVSGDQTCRVYNLANGEALLTLTFNSVLTAVTYDAPCWQLFIGSSEGIVYQYDLRNPPRNLYHHVEKINKKIFEGQKGKIVSIAINITDTLLASGNDNDVVYIWEIKTRQILRVIGHKGSITNIKFLLGSRNIFDEKFKVSKKLKALEKITNVSDDKLVIGQMQTDDININGKETSLEKENSLRFLTKENIKLRCINMQLYNAALRISKKYNCI